MVAAQFSYPKRTYTTAPQIVPPRGGLLDTADVRDFAASDPILRGYVYETHAGDVVADDVSFSVADATGDATFAVDGDLVYVTSLPSFTISSEIHLELLDETYAGTVEERAAARFALAEGIKVEDEIWKGALAANATLLRSGTALKPSKAIGYLAEWIGTRYAGVPHFHAGRRVSNEIAASQLTVLPDDGMSAAQVKGGGILVNGAGYTDKTGPTGATAATTDQAWLYVSGTPLLVRGPVIVPPNAPDYAHNVDRSVAMRKYVPSFDAPIAAVLVDLT